MYLLSYIKECLRSLLSLKCISLIFVISRREITFEDVATFGGLLLSKGRYFRGGGGVVTLGSLWYCTKNCLKVVNIKTPSANIAFFCSSPLLLPLHIFFLFLF